MLAALSLAFTGSEATEPPSAAETRASITALLGEFLSRVDDPEMHRRFWADDLIYTSGQGAVRTKKQIVESVAAAVDDPRAARMRYAAEEVTVRPYGAFAALNFRLVIHNADGATWYSRNSGALLWCDDQWQVVTWQATRESPASP